MTTTGPIDVLAKLTDPDIARDPFAFLHWLRDDPVHRTREGTYLLTRYADVKWVLQKTGINADSREQGVSRKQGVIRTKVVARAGAEWSIGHKRCRRCPRAGDGVVGVPT